MRFDRKHEGLGIVARSRCRAELVVPILVAHARVERTFLPDERTDVEHQVYPRKCFGCGIGAESVLALCSDVVKKAIEFGANRFDRNAPSQTDAVGIIEIHRLADDAVMVALL